MKRDNPLRTEEDLCQSGTFEETHGMASHLVDVHRRLAREALDKVAMQQWGYDEESVMFRSDYPAPQLNGEGLPADIVALSLPWKHLRRFATRRESQRRRAERFERYLESPMVGKLVSWLFTHPSGQVTGSLACFTGVIATLAALVFFLQHMEPSSRFLALILGIGVSLLLLLLGRRILEGLEPKAQNSLAARQDGSESSGLGSKVP